MKPRDIVKRVDKQGQPTGRPLEVVNIGDHAPVDAPLRKDSIAYLHDGSWEFIWNLVVIAYPADEQES